MTSLGLCVATWVGRQGRAIGMNVTFFILLACAWPMVFLMSLPGPPHPDNWRWDLLSPIATVSLIVGDLVGPVYDYRMPIGTIAAFDAAVLLAAIILLVANIRTFDRNLGRMPEGRTLPEPEVMEDWPPTRRPGARDAGGRQNGPAVPPSLS